MKTNVSKTLQKIREEELRRICFENGLDFAKLPSQMQFLLSLAYVRGGMNVLKVLTKVEEKGERLQDGHYPACAEQPQGFPCRCDEIADELREKEIEAQIEEALAEYEKD
jgi:hypothetical protein